MSNIDLNELQIMVQDKLSFTTLEDYVNLCQVFLELVKEMQPTRIISPTNYNYFFYQYGLSFDHRITRPLNTDLFIEDVAMFQAILDRFMSFINDLRQHQEFTAEQAQWQGFIEAREIDKVIYTL